MSKFGSYALPKPVSDFRNAERPKKNFPHMSTGSLSHFEDLMGTGTQ
jgi:hypothetical protein